MCPDFLADGKWAGYGTTEQRCIQISLQMANVPGLLTAQGAELGQSGPHSSCVPHSTWVAPACGCRVA